MKTDAIKECVRVTREVIGLGISDVNSAAKAEAELEAIETALAAKNAALQEIIDNEAPFKRDPLAFATSVIERHVEIAEAALSPPTGKVLIDVEKLRQIHYWISCANWAGPFNSERDDLIRDVGGLLLKENDV